MPLVFKNSHAKTKRDLAILTKTETAEGSKSFSEAVKVPAQDDTTPNATTKTSSLRASFVGVLTAIAASINDGAQTYVRALTDQPMHQTEEEAMDDVLDEVIEYVYTKKLENGNLTKEEERKVVKALRIINGEEKSCEEGGE